MALESRCLQETQRRARALSEHNSPERGLLSQGAKASPGPRLPKQKPSGRVATIHSCPVRSASCPGKALTFPGSQPSSGTELAGSPDSDKLLSFLLLPTSRGGHYHAALFTVLAVDREEWEQEAQVSLSMWKVLQSLRQAEEKLRQAVGHLQGQKKEMWLQQGPQVLNRPRKVRLRLTRGPMGEKPNFPHNQMWLFRVV